MGRGIRPYEGKSRLNHTRHNLLQSLNKSLSFLGKIDLFYIHRASNNVLKDKIVIDEMLNLKNKNIIYIGASFSTEVTLEEAIYDDLVTWCDVIQLPSNVFLKRPDLVKYLRLSNIGIVVNSPIRKGLSKSPSETFTELINQKEISVILTGTRNHLIETINFFKDF